VPPEQRQFNLILALMATEHGLTKQDILSTVAGYAERFDDASDRASLERQFERDKEDVRELGVPLETVDQPGAEGDTRLQRYRIPKSLYQLPDDIEFSAEEVALLGLAAQVWRESSLSEQSRRALTKLKSFGHAVEQSVIGFAPSIRTRESAHDPLAEAIDRRRRVSFPYLKPGAAERVQRELQEVFERTTATVVPRPGSEADVVLRNRAGTVVEGEALIVRTTDLAVLAEELATFGADIRVLGPDQVREAVLERWRRVVSAHG